MSAFSPSRRRFMATSATLCAMGSALAGCSTAAPVLSVRRPSAAAGVYPATMAQLTNRITWGTDTGALSQLAELGRARYIEQQLHPSPVALPAVAQAQIDAMSITRRSFVELVQSLEEQRKSAAMLADDNQKNAARKAYQQELTRVAREAAARSLLRALYSPNQLYEQMSWFWMNHFNIYQRKRDLRAMVGDYEEHAIRPHALGRFRDLLGATAHHPAMLRYLDNEQNAANRINENYARELMELHTLGVGSGYTQRDVQELARILTGVGVNLKDHADSPEPKLRRELQGQYLRRGLFEFNPRRHDYGDKQFLGQVVRGQGLAELETALDRLARAPATARFISHKLAVFLMADEPSPALVERMAQTFAHSDGGIADVLRTLFDSTEFQHSLGRQFKDPMHYVLSTVRLAYEGSVVLNTGPMLNWLNQLGEPLYGRLSPDGYPLNGDAWDSSGQMTTRFEIARALGAGATALFKPPDAGPPLPERPPLPRLKESSYFASIKTSLSAATRQALEQATSPQEWNAFLLSSPEMMRR